MRFLKCSEGKTKRERIISKESRNDLKALSSVINM
jgi:hypothetical protein